MSGTARRIAALAALFLLPAGAARAAEIPAWLKASIDRPVPDGIDRKSIVHLHSEKMTDVSGSTVTSRFREAFRVTGVDGRDTPLHAPQSISDDFKMTGAWKVSPTGSVEAFSRKAIHQFDADSSYEFSMSKVNVLDTGGSRVGDVVAWEYTIRSKPEAAVDAWSFGDMEPTLLSRFGIRLPRGWELRTVTRNMQVTEPFVDDEGYSAWEMRDVRGLEPEPMGALPADLLPSMMVSYGPTGDHAGRFESWEEVGELYAQISEKQIVADRSIRTTLDEITRGSSNPLESIRSVARFVQDVRYLNVAIGRSAFEPHPAPLILKNRFGDCEDKTILTITLLRELGIKAYPILVRTASAGALWTEVPGFQFNHVVVGVNTGSDQDPSASLDAGPLGRLVIFDPTDSVTAFGDIDWSLQGVMGVVSHETQAKLVALPVLPPESSRREADIQVSFPDRGGIDVKATVTHSGQYAALMRAHYESVRGPQRKDEFLASLKSHYGSAEIRELVVSGVESPGDDLVLTLDFWMPLPGIAAGDLMTMATRFALSTRARKIPGEERTAPLVIPSGYEESERTTIRMPDGWEAVLPLPSAEENSSIGSYSIASGVENDRVMIERRLTVKKSTVAPGESGAVSSFFDSVLRRDAGEIALRKSPSGS